MGKSHQDLSRLISETKVILILNIWIFEYLNEYLFYEQPGGGGRRPDGGIGEGGGGGGGVGRGFFFEQKRFVSMIKFLVAIIIFVL